MLSPVLPGSDAIAGSPAPVSMVGLTTGNLVVGVDLGLALNQVAGFNFVKTPGLFSGVFVSWFEVLGAVSFRKTVTGGF